MSNIYIIKLRINLQIKTIGSLRRAAYYNTRDVAIT